MIDPKSGCFNSINELSKTNSRNAKPSLKRDNISLSEVAGHWLRGENVDWDALYYGKPKPYRVSLPTYPFNREKHWIANGVPDLIAEEARNGEDRLHPLISYNASTINQISFTSILSGQDIFSKEHKVNSKNVLPGAGLLEIACVAGTLATQKAVTKIRDIVWINPLYVHKNIKPVETYLKSIGEHVEYEIVSMNSDGIRIVHSEGRLEFSDNKNQQEVFSVDEALVRLPRAISGEECYQTFDKLGIQYGDGFRTISKIHTNGCEAIAEAKICEKFHDSFDQYILHPIILDTAFQSVVSLYQDNGVNTPHLPFSINELVIYQSIPKFCYIHVIESFDSVKSSHGIKSFDIRMINKSGGCVVKINGFHVRSIKNQFDTNSEKYAVNALNVASE